MEGGIALMFRVPTAVLAVVAAFPAFAGSLVGTASVIDGDTIEIHGQRIRLHGIDAPESKQLCLDALGKKYRCGQRAALALADFIDSRQPVSCREVDRDRYGRVVAVCKAGGVDIGGWMVRQGHALDWPHFSLGAYIAVQREAQGARRGIWAGSFALPWEWRQLHDAATLHEGT